MAADPGDVGPDAWNPKVRAIFDYWLAKAPGPGMLPGRRDIDPVDLRRLLPWVWMVDIVRAPGEPPRFRYRLLGTAHTQAMGTDRTGAFIDEAHPLFATSGAMEDYLAVAKGQTSWRRGPILFHTDKTYLSLERIMLPLAADGRTPDIILALTVYLRPQAVKRRR